MILKQNSSNYTTFLGWYGKCETTCENFNLAEKNSEKIIFSVFQFSEDGMGVKTYNASAPSFLNSFNELECGKGYWIVLNPGDSEIDVPNFTASKSQPGSVGLLTQSCEVAPTPTPQQTSFVSEPHGRFRFTINNTSGNSKYDDRKYKDVFIDAFNTWDKVITSPVGKWREEDGSVVDHYLTIEVDFAQMEQGVLGAAWIKTVVGTDQLPIFGKTFAHTGAFQLNIDYMDGMFNGTTSPTGKNELFYVALHEIGHILGIGSLTFSSSQILQKPVVNYTDDGDGQTKMYYNGENALREYKAAFSSKSGLVGVPVEDDGGRGTRDSHPEEGSGSVSSDDRLINGVHHPGLQHELMTGWSDASQGISLPMSRITLGFLEDIGFGVDYNLADPYSESDLDDIFAPTPTAEFPPPIPLVTPTPTDVDGTNVKKN